MRKYFILFVILIISFALYGQLINIDIQDNSGNFLGPDSEDAHSWALTIVEAGGDGVINAPNSDGTPGGDDYFPINNLNWEMTAQNWGNPGYIWSNYFQSQTVGQTEPYANLGDMIYVRVYNNVDKSIATHYIDNFNVGLYTLSSAGNFTIECGGLWGEWTAIESSTSNLDWGDGMSGNVVGGVPSSPGSGSGNGLPHEDLLANMDNIGYFFTLTIDDASSVEVTVCLDQVALGYAPMQLAYWINNDWIYLPQSGNLNWSESGTVSSCITFTIDPVAKSIKKVKSKSKQSKVSRMSNVSQKSSTHKLTTQKNRADLAVPIVFSNGEDNPLPVVLSSFTAIQVENDMAQIIWQTASESNLNNFIVYREELLIGSVEPTNTSEVHEYMVQDVELEAGNTYIYYLEAVEYDGNTETYGPITLTITENSDPNEPPIINVLETTLQGNFPNPFNPVTNIRFSIVVDEEGLLEIYNLKGSLIKTERFGSGIHSYQWDAKNNASGVYFYKLKTKSYVETKKMILLK